MTAVHFDVQEKVSLWEEGVMKDVVLEEEK